VDGSFYYDDDNKFDFKVEFHQNCGLYMFVTT